jgi:hypothetical protein
MKTQSKNEAGDTDSLGCGCVLGVIFTILALVILVPIAFAALMAFLGV